MLRQTAMTRMSRALAAVALLALAAPVVDAAAGWNEARAEAQDDIAVGTELVATADVTLHKAEISKGSHVSVTQLNVHDGRVDAVSVALADGHVVKVTMGTVRSYFRVAE
jgi:hypothetical protein